MKEIYINANDKETYSRVITGAMLSEWQFNFPGKIIPAFESAKKFYHGNSKLLIHMFYNDITGKHELQVTTKTVEKSYPQIKSVKPFDFDKTQYETYVKIFGRI